MDKVFDYQLKECDCQCKCEPLAILKLNHLAILNLGH